MERRDCICEREHSALVLLIAIFSGQSKRMSQVPFCPISESVFNCELFVSLDSILSFKVLSLHFQESFEN